MGHRDSRRIFSILLALDFFLTLLAGEGRAALWNNLPFHGHFPPEAFSWPAPPISALLLLGTCVFLHLRLFHTSFLSPVLATNSWRVRTKPEHQHIQYLQERVCTGSEPVMQVCGSSRLPMAQSFAFLVPCKQTSPRLPFYWIPGANQPRNPLGD